MLPSLSMNTLSSQRKGSTLGFSSLSFLLLDYRSCACACWKQLSPAKRPLLALLPLRSSVARVVFISPELRSYQRVTLCAAR